MSENSQRDFMAGQVTEFRGMLKRERQRVTRAIEADESQAPGSALCLSRRTRAGQMIANQANRCERVGRRAEPDVPQDEFAAGIPDALRQMQLADVKRFGFRFGADARMEGLVGGERVNAVRAIGKLDEFVSGSRGHNRFRHQGEVPGLRVKDLRRTEPSDSCCIGAWSVRGAPSIRRTTVEEIGSGAAAGTATTNEQTDHASTVTMADASRSDDFEMRMGMILCSAITPATFRVGNAGMGVVAPLSCDEFTVIRAIRGRLPFPDLSRRRLR